MLRSENRGMLGEGGAESVFRLACALDGAGIVVLDAGAGKIGTKVAYFMLGMRFSLHQGAPRSYRPAGKEMAYIVKLDLVGHIS